MPDEEITVEAVQRLVDAYTITDPHGFTVRALQWAVDQYYRAYDKYLVADDEADCWCSRALTAENALVDAKEEGRQEIRDAVNALLDTYSPHAVEWWNKLNNLTKPTFRDSKMK